LRDDGDSLAVGMPAPIRKEVSFEKKEHEKIPQSGKDKERIFSIVNDVYDRSPTASDEYAAGDESTPVRLKLPAISRHTKLIFASAFLVLLFVVYPFISFVGNSALAIKQVSGMQTFY